MTASNVATSHTDTGVLQAENLTFAHEGKPPVFADVSFSVRPRETLALLGASGCGKSTMLRLLAGLEKPLQGRVQFLGQPLTQPHPRSALVFQQASLLPWLNVADNVSFGLDFRHQPRITAEQKKTRVRNALQAVGMAGHEKSSPAQLSGGMAQRVALARALAREPQLLFADEPFSALDPITRSEMQNLLVDVVRRWHTAALLVTHDIDEAILVADRILLMGGSPARIIAEWNVELPHPRSRYPHAIQELRQHVLEGFRSCNSQNSGDFRQPEFPHAVVRDTSQPFHSSI
jgi:ABC-type nitrate/sulfonate/bicarbonate transport system, ATPase component